MKQLISPDLRIQVTRKVSSSLLLLSSLLLSRVFKFKSRAVHKMCK